MKSAVLLCANALLVVASAAAPPLRPAMAAETASLPAPRVEARSPTTLAVGVVRGDRMTIHVSRLADNAPVRDAVLTVLLRGASHPATAEADGGYAIQTPDLTIPGSASVVFRVAVDNQREELAGTLQITDNPSEPKDKNSARQLWWWALNFAVCIGFLMLLSRRRKTAASD